MSGSLDRGGRDDVRQRRALQRLVKDPSSSVGAFIPSDVPLDTLGTPSDNTNLNATTGYHGLLPKLSGVVTEFLNGLGQWSVPAGSGGGALIKTTELDFGADSVHTATFTVTDADILAGTFVTFQRSNEAATSRDQDENEFADFNIEVLQNVGSLTVLFDVRDGRVSGKFKFNYSIVGP